MPPRKIAAAERELVEFLERLPWVKVGRNNYTRIDQVRDFTATFQESESGRRVLAQIQAMCDTHIGPQDADKPGKLAWAAGQRHVMAQIMFAMNMPEAETIKEEDKTDVDS